MTATRRASGGVAALHIGCAGWSLSSGVTAHFSSEGTHLERYARVFSAVEINSSFYRPHQPKTYGRWAESVPDSFRFSVKVPRRITHELRLRDAEATLAEFLEQVSALGTKLGCLLLQLPPSLAFNSAEATTFFTTLRRLTDVSSMCEPRHASWFTPEAAAALQAADIGFVHAHPAPVPDAEPPTSGATLYFRLHGAPRIYYSSYDDTFLDALAAQITAAQASGRAVWCIFDNTAGGHAVPNALDLTVRLRP